MELTSELVRCYTFELVRMIPVTSESLNFYGEDVSFRTALFHITPAAAGLVSSLLLYLSAPCPRYCSLTCLSYQARFAVVPMVEAIVALVLIDRLMAQYTECQLFPINPEFHDPHFSKTLPRTRSFYPFLTLEQKANFCTIFKSINSYHGSVYCTMIKQIMSYLTVLIVIGSFAAQPNQTKQFSNIIDLKVGSTHLA
ncbi:hypothetical protein L6452_30623 [Arctium lappa]|uniref:Uncharacterized protein n=1 Tax=Arctium lappa TaxID=4217 RepID=A0ACB8ZJP5_ARCLA|nr:hypothetical protein L6452_30623 [Arctium lappa]